MELSHYISQINSVPSISLKEAREILDKKIIIAARDGIELTILHDLLNGNFSSILDNQREVINSAIYIAALNEQKDALTILLDSGRTDISALSDTFLFEEIKELQETLLGDQDTDS